jgi:hypothetical protein
MGIDIPFRIGIEDLSPTLENTPKLTPDQISRSWKRRGSMATANPTMYVEHLVSSSEGYIKCVIRCMRGVVTPGLWVSASLTESAPDSSSRVRVSKIWRYGREVDLIDPPHGGMIELVGQGIDLITKVLIFMVLMVTTPLLPDQYFKGRTTARR